MCPSTRIQNFSQIYFFCAADFGRFGVEWPRGEAAELDEGQNNEHPAHELDEEEEPDPEEGIEGADDINPKRLNRVGLSTG